MKYYLKFVLMSAAMALQGVCTGGVPLEWTRRPDSTTPANFTAHQGETLELCCTFRGFGELPFGDGGDVRLYFQTNGMGEAWWSAPATVSSNEVRAVWGPEMDVGASRWVFFFGTPGVVYSSAIVRLLPSPGFVPVVQPLPDVAFDAALVGSIVTNIAKEIMNAAASPSLRELVPDITDATVTLAPVDGAANHVGGKVEVAGRLVSTGGGSFEFQMSGDLRDDTGTLVGSFDARDQGFSGVLSFEYVGHVDADVITYRMTVLKDYVIYDSNNGSMPFFKFIQGRSCEVCRIIYPQEFQEGDKYDTGQLSWYMSPWDVLGDYVYNYSDGATPEFYTHSLSGFYDTELTPDKSPIVTLPESADTTKARKFTLAVETDVDTEKEVTWQGGEVIEAVPGASKLVPGLTVWDVAEVAPGKFKVERASNPAQSAPLTLTAPNGRVAELTVDDDLVLEVKEK